MSHQRFLFICTYRWYCLFRFCHEKFAVFFSLAIFVVYLSVCLSTDSLNKNFDWNMRLLLLPREKKRIPQINLYMTIWCQFTKKKKKNEMNCVDESFARQLYIWYFWMTVYLIDKIEIYVIFFFYWWFFDQINCDFILSVATLFDLSRIVLSVFFFFFGSAL